MAHFEKYPENIFLHLDSLHNVSSVHYAYRVLSIVICLGVFILYLECVSWLFSLQQKCRLNKQKSMKQIITYKANKKGKSDRKIFIINNTLELIAKALSIRKNNRNVNRKQGRHTSRDLNLYWCLLDKSNHWLSR